MKLFVDGDSQPEPRVYAASGVRGLPKRALHALCLAGSPMG